MRRVWVTLGVAATISFVGWSLWAYRANAEGKRAARSDAAVAVAHEGGLWLFAPTDTARHRTSLLFLPGALVDPRAYAPLARAAALAGFHTVIVELPRRGAFGGADSPELDRRIGAALARLEPAVVPVVAGHSRGAVVAARVASERAAAIYGLVLIGTSHPRDVDLSRLANPVLKIVGTRDGLASPPEVRQNAALLPSSTTWLWIDGGNHSQFGWYGFQPLDRRPAIAAAEQRRLMTDAVIDFLLRVDGRAAAMPDQQD